MKCEKVILIGAGNLATHLGKAIQKAGHTILQVYSRTNESAKKLAIDFDAEPITDIRLLKPEASMLVFAVNESGLPDLLQNITVLDSQMIIHTSGSVNMDIFKEKANNYGVLYPLQTFSKFRPVNFLEIPVFIEANTKENLARLMNFSQDISTKINIADSKQRQFLHLSAVFFNNFVNHFYTLGYQVSVDHGCRFGFDVFKPLIIETAMKAVESGNPSQCQTGPAIRGNEAIIQRHTELLEKNPDYQKLYTFVSESIGNYYKTGK